MDELKDISNNGEAELPRKKGLVFYDDLSATSNRSHLSGGRGGRVCPRARGLGAFSRRRARARCVPLAHPGTSRRRSRRLPRREAAGASARGEEGADVSAERAERGLHRAVVIKWVRHGVRLLLRGATEGACKPGQRVRQHRGDLGGHRAACGAAGAEGGGEPGGPAGLGV